MQNTTIPSIKAVAIDLDGTLINSIPDICQSVNLTLSALGHRTLPLEQVETFVGKGYGEHVRKSLRVVTGRDPSEAEMADAMQRYRAHYAEHLTDNTTLYPGVVEGLQAFKERGLKLSLVTNKWRVYSEILLKHFGLDTFFDHLVCGDTLLTNKPDPEMVVYSAGLHGVHPREVLMLGDSGNDSRAAQRAGASIILLSYGYSEGERLEDLKPNAIVGNFMEIPPLLV